MSVAVRRRLPRPSGLAAIATVPGALILGLLGIVVWISFRVDVNSTSLTLQHYRDVVGDDFVVEALFNTVAFSLVATATAFAFGLPIAWLIERSDLRGRSVLYLLLSIGMFVPGFFTGMGWILFLHPRIGIAHGWLPFDILSLVGMGFVQGFSMAGLVVMFTAASLRSTDAALEEAAAMSGATWAQTMRRIVLPLAWPGILAALLFLVAINLSAFDIPLLIGVPNRIYTFSTFLLTTQSLTTDGLPPYGLTSAFGTVMIVLALGLSWWYGRMMKQSQRYAVVSGKSFKRRPVALGRWRPVAWAFVGGYFGLSIVMPLVLLVWTALLPYFQPFSTDAFGTLGFDNFRELPWELVRKGLSNTAILMLVTPVLAFVASVATSWYALRRRTRLSRALDYLAFLPMTIPAVIFAFAALITVLNVGLPFGLQLYGTLPLLVVVYALSTLGFATRTTTTALIQIHADLEDAAKMSGAGQLTTLRRVVVPLVAPALLYGSLWIALLIFRDITIANILFTSDNVTVSMVVWNLWNAGDLGRSSALNLIMLVVLIPLVFAYLRYAGTTALQQHDPT